jgi:hypothetical protein
MAGCFYQWLPEHEFVCSCLIHLLEQFFTERWDSSAKTVRRAQPQNGPDSYPTSMRKWDKAFPNLGSLQFRTRG